MEEMLKSWFPNVKLQDQVVVTQTEEAAPSKKLKVKFEKQPRLCKNFQIDGVYCQGHMVLTQ